MQNTFVYVNIFHIMTAKKVPVHKESFLHKLTTTVISAAVMATVGGILGYQLNSHLPEIYYHILPVTPTGKHYRGNIEVSNLGRGPATQIVIRYTFDETIQYCTYNYSEALNGRLASENISGGKGYHEFLIKIPRLLPKDTLSASFYFKNEPKNGQVKVFAEEVVGRPYSDWTEKITSPERFKTQAKLLTNSLRYRIQKPNLSLPLSVAGTLNIGLAPTINKKNLGN